MSLALDTHPSKIASGFRSLFLSRLFIRLAVLYALIGMGMGVYMGVSEDWTLRPVHVHVTLIGWVSTALYALIYKTSPQMGEDFLAIPHALISTTAMATTIIAMPLYLHGEEWAAPVTHLSFLGHFASMILFALVVVRRY